MKTSPMIPESDFYEMEIGTAGLMRSYMARKCDIHFSVGTQSSAAFDGGNAGVSCTGGRTGKGASFIQSLDIKAIATEVMYKLFAMLEMKYDFKLSKNGEMENKMKKRLFSYPACSVHGALPCADHGICRERDGNPACLQL